MKSCCVTGHRTIVANQIEFVKDELLKQIRQAIQDGYTNFISGMADGTDLYFLSIVAEIKEKTGGITLEAAIPHRSRMYTKNLEFQRLIKLCDTINVTAEEYSKGSYLERNKYMVGKSERVIAVFDGRETGGTGFTIKFAKLKKRELFIISVSELKK